MPEAPISTGNADTISKSTQPSQMGPPRLLDEPLDPPTVQPPLHSVGDASLAVSGALKEQPHPIDKKSWSYLVRSGVAGGFAGCAVRSSLLHEQQLTRTGENSRRTT